MRRHQPSLSYRPAGQHGSREHAEAFYRELASHNGWKLRSTDAPMCMTREVDGAEVSLEVSAEPESYVVSASTWPC